MESNNQQANVKKPIRVWVDGCFDLVHFGHANALRQAKALGDQLIVGVHSDISVGTLVLIEDDRYMQMTSFK
ncbi:unnamed protein product [Trichobilharzia regenti]|nr:unnamed protein product [Trichobilharzia regenti]